MEDHEYLLEMEDVVKEFSGVKALKGVSLRVKRGEVHALVGENGAGKSTLMKCLLGTYKLTSGKVIFDGKERSGYSVHDALSFGLSMIPQELSPVKDRSILANIFLGREPRNKFGFVDWDAMYIKSKEFLAEIGMTLDPKILMSELSVAQMQMVEIAKAISTNAKLVIMDEPTSPLTEREVDKLFEIIRMLKSRNVSVIYISHRLEEIYKICDRITVLRDGESVGSEDADKLPYDTMIEWMVGRTIDTLYPKIPCEIGDVQLEVKHLSHKKFFHDVSFQARKGEIFGIAGLVGAGRSELIETIFGIREKSSGEVLIDGKPVEIHGSEDAIKKGMALVTEERRYNGIFAILSVGFNITIANMRTYVNKFGLLNRKKIKSDCEESIKSFGVKTPSPDTLIENLSGGNQQKALLARWLLTKPDIIFLDEPTRGIDVGSKAEIHRLISELAGQGKTVVMVSSELPEIMGMSDRIMVMYEGRVTAILDNNQSLRAETLGAYLSGKTDVSTEGGAKKPVAQPV